MSQVAGVRRVIIHNETRKRIDDVNQFLRGGEGYSAAKLHCCIVMLAYVWLTFFCGIALADERDAPIDIYAESLTVDHQKATATFIGKVVAKQAEMTISADYLRVHYKLNDQAEGKETSGELTKLLVNGHVVMKTPKYKVQSEKGEYDVRTERLVLTKNVLLEQGENKMHGQRFVYNHKTQKGKMAAGSYKPTNSIDSLDKMPKVKVVINPEEYGKPAP